MVGKHFPIMPYHHRTDTWFAFKLLVVPASATRLDRFPSPGEVLQPDSPKGSSTGSFSFAIFVAIVSKPLLRILTDHFLVK